MNFIHHKKSTRLFLIKSAAASRTSARCIHICENISEMRAYRRDKGDKTIGFVPTMGALHSGHVSLAYEAKKDCEVVIGSIFVNPTQFGPNEDLAKYPRTLEKDLSMFEKAGVDCVFVPKDTQEMYPINPLCHVEPAPFSSILEGMARPDFFRGVATVVCKLFNIIQPTHAYFGQKDISQCILIQRLVEDLNMPVRIKVCPTKRDKDGLALSSRNVYLTEKERSVADILFKALSAGKAFCQSSNRSVSKSEVVSVCASVLASEPLVTQIEYVSFASPFNMNELEAFEMNRGDGGVLSSAIRLGTVRLIDNLLVGSADEIIYARF